MPTLRVFYQWRPSRSKTRDHGYLYLCAFINRNNKQKGVSYSVERNNPINAAKKVCAWAKKQGVKPGRYQDVLMLADNKQKELR